MNKINPFMQPGSLQEQKERKRAQFKIAVYSVFGLTFLLMCFFLIQGCKRESPTESLLPTNNAPDTNVTVVDTNLATPPGVLTNTTPQSQVQQPVPQPIPQPVPQPIPAPTSSTQEYTVMKGDSFYSIGKKYGVKIKEIVAANPNVVPAKLKVGQKLQIPAPGGSAAPASVDSASGDSYKVKSGDTLGKIAKQFGLTVKALSEANDLKSTKIKVGQTLKVPAKGAVAEIPAAVPQPVPAPAPVSNGMPASPTR